jgi:hypothetical protein
MSQHRDSPPCSPTSTDWRGWIALAWVLGWGFAYSLMVVQARAPQVLAWARALMSHN